MTINIKREKTVFVLIEVLPKNLDLKKLFLEIRPKSNKSSISVSPLHRNLQVANFQRCEHVLECPIK